MQIVQSVFTILKSIATLGRLSIVLQVENVPENMYLFALHLMQITKLYNQLQSDKKTAIKLYRCRKFAARQLKHCKCNICVCPVLFLTSVQLNNPTETRSGAVSVKNPFFRGRRLNHPYRWLITTMQHFKWIINETTRKSQAGKRKKVNYLELRTLLLLGEFDSLNQPWGVRKSCRWCPHLHVQCLPVFQWILISVSLRGASHF